MIDPDLIDVALLVFLFLGALFFATSIATRLKREKSLNSLEEELLKREKERHEEIRNKMQQEFSRIEKMIRNDYESLTHLFMETTVDAIKCATETKSVSEPKNMKQIPKRRGRPPKQLPPPA